MSKTVSKSPEIAEFSRMHNVSPSRVKVVKNASGEELLMIKPSLGREILRHKDVYLLLLIPIVFYFIFKYVPIFNAQIAFKNFRARDGVLGSQWVGFQNFVDLMGGSATWTQGFVRVAIWNLIWAVMATATCYFGGLIIAVLLKEINFKIANLSDTDRV